MRIVHLVAGDLRQGAHLGAYSLHEGLVEIGVDSWVLTTDPRNILDRKVVSVRQGALARTIGRVRRRAERIPKYIYTGMSEHHFSTGLFGGSVSRHPLVQSADIVNLHWVARDLIRLSDLKRIRARVVWTLRDMWPFTGGCHYSLDCTAWQTLCGSCPHLSSNREGDLSTWLQKLKRDSLPEDMVCVGISNWISECARRSFVLSGSEVYTILNCIDLDHFFPEDKAEAKSAIGLTSSRPVVLIGSAKVGDRYKGLDLFLEGAHRLEKLGAQLVVFGEATESTRSILPDGSLFMGFVQKKEELRRLYSAADVYVAPSRQEAFGKTLAEAMACGTPVVAFDYAGPQDVVAHGLTGYLAYPFSSSDLWRGVEWVIEHKNPDVLGINSWKRAVSEFSVKRAAERYRDLYFDLLTGRGKT